jgi:hypothetical protein
MLAVKERQKRPIVELKREQWEYLNSLKRSKGESVAAQTREAVDEYIKKQKKLARQAAARAMVDDYTNDKELIAFTALDGEPIL